MADYRAHVYWLRPVRWAGTETGGDCGGGGYAARAGLCLPDASSWRGLEWPSAGVLGGASSAPSPQCNPAPSPAPIPHPPLGPPLHRDRTPALQA